MMEGVQDVSSVWRPYSGGTSATSVSSITYTECLGCRAYEERATLGGNRGVEGEETVDASSGKGGRLFTSNGKLSRSEPASLELNIEGSGSGRGLLCLFRRKGSRGRLLVLDVCAGKSDIGKEENEYVRLDCDCDNDGVGWRADDRIGWYARTGGADDDDGEEATVEGTIDGALCCFIEEKCWLAKYF